MTDHIVEANKKVIDLDALEKLADEDLPVSITGIGGNCPVQGYGTVAGEPFYFRARGEHWSIEIGGGFVLEDPAKGIPRDGFYMEEEWGDGPYDAGWMEQEQAKALIYRAARAFLSRNGKGEG
jgi:hypothetical protein